MTAVRIPADVDRPDRLLAGLTARQLAELALAGVMALIIRAATSGLPLPLSMSMCALPIGIGAALALATHDGLGGDRFVLAWLAHLRRPRRLVAAPAGVVAPPRLGVQRNTLPAALDLPVRAISDDGTIDLGDGNHALICRTSSLNFGLRTEEEQVATAAALGRWFNSLAEPVQIVVHTEPVDAGELVADVQANAASLPHPDLEAAARDHIRFVTDLVARRNVLRREVLMVFTHRGDADAASTVLGRRADEAASGLHAAGLAVTRVLGGGAATVLARCANPESPTSPGVLAWAADPIVRGVTA